MLRIKIKRYGNVNDTFGLQLEASSTWNDLLKGIHMKLNETPKSIFKGYPSLELLSPSSDDQSLSDLGIHSGDTLIIKSFSVNSISNPKPELMLIREMPDDNNCLFSAVNYVCHHDRNANNLRELVAALILSSPSEYTEAILGMPPEKYVEWIQVPTHWGGAIELSIFAKYYKYEFASVDVATGRVDIFGEGNFYQKRVYLLYSGIHYDALALVSTPDGPEASDVTIFSPYDDHSFTMALQVAEIAKLEHRYTDTAGFTLICEDCKKAIIGEKDARLHATETGHLNFTEYNKS